MLAIPIVATYRERADIEVIDCSFNAAINIARERITKGLVDVFVSAGANASLLRSELKAPVATIQLGGFDILQVLIKARQMASRVGIVMYGQTIPELESVKGLLNIDIRQYAYQTPDTARQCIEELQKAGIEVVVGSSLVVELAENAGLQGLLAYSLASIRQGFEDALELARVVRLEAGRYEQLNGVLHNLQDAVLAVNQAEQLIAINPAMQQILGLQRTPLPGCQLSTLTTDLSLQTTLRAGRQERGVVLRLGGRDWVANRTPISEKGQIVGAAVTLYDARTIHEADNNLRIQHRRGQSAARYRFDDLIGESPAFVRAVASARRYAQTGLGVMISGESGTGKELFAQAIHNESDRMYRPFVAVNCAAFPESLLESELFGYEEGAFTGSRRGGKRGLFEAAHTGTLFLDEIGDMPLTLQTRLLRVLQERQITRLGATTAIPVDVRVLAATHRPLLDMVTARSFRQDLYYRINVLRLMLPPLRERRADIGLLAENALTACLSQLNSSLDSGQALAPLKRQMQAYAWPGNVRELKNICERIAVFLLQFESSHAIDYAELVGDCPELFESGVTLSMGALTSNQNRALEALKKNGGHHAKAAQQLGVSRSTFWRWCRQTQTLDIDVSPGGGNKLE